jgi:large subunit ribosomal protein L10
MLTRKQKEQIVEELTDKIKRQKSLIFTDITGVKVTEAQNLRRELRKAEIEYKIAKKSLIDLVLKKNKQDIETSQFAGTLALAFSYRDPVLPVKIIDDFSKEHKNLKILGGIMEDKILTVEDIKELAKIPSRDELLATFVCNLKGPITGFVNVLRGNIRNLVGLLEAIISK